MLTQPAPTEKMEQRAHPDQFGFDRWFREREIVCVVYAIPVETGLFRPLTSLSRRFGVLMFGAMKNVFFYARLQSDHHQPACRIVNPSQCGSSRAQVTLDDFVVRAGPCGAFDPPLQQKSRLRLRFRRHYRWSKAVSYSHEIPKMIF